MSMGAFQPVKSASTSTKRPREDAEAAARQLKQATSRRDDQPKAKRKLRQTLEKSRTMTLSSVESQAGAMDPQRHRQHQPVMAQQQAVLCHLVTVHLYPLPVALSLSRCQTRGRRDTYNSSQPGISCRTRETTTPTHRSRSRTAVPS